jgi:hypothetical protein
MAVWTSSTGGLWSNTDNWAGLAPPGNNASVSFVNGSYTSVIDPAFLVTALNSVNLSPGMILDVQHSISMKAINGSFSANGSPASSGLLEIGNGATLTYIPAGGSLVNTTNGLSGFYVKGDGVGAEGKLLVSGAIDTGATITLSGVNFDATGGIVDSSATVTLQNGATYAAQAGETFGVGTVRLAGGGTADFAAMDLAFTGFDPSDQQLIMSGANNKLVLPNNPDGTALNIIDFGVTDKIEIAGLSGVGSVTHDANDDLNFFAGINGTGALLASLTNVDMAAGVDPVLGAGQFSVVNDASGATVTFVACFTSGTKIETPDGERDVETIRVGDMVMAQAEDGWEAHRVIWTGHRSIDISRHPEPQAVAPVRIRKDAFGPNIPHRDLVLSGDHAVFVDEGLVPARLLINGISIVQEMPDRIEYFHIECETHSVLLAEGLTVESYLDTGTRRNEFDGGSVKVLYPQFRIDPSLCWETLGCHPLLLAPSTVRPIRQRLLDRATYSVEDQLAA